VPRGDTADADMIKRFAEAFESDDIDGVVALLTADAVVSMPPELEWHQGRESIEAFLRARLEERRPGGWRFHPVAANLQPAIAYYLEDEDGWARAGLFVVGVGPDGIESITRFPDDGLLDRFGAPARL
jgi:limonene-1,2-epoxide hydrolase